MSGVAAWLGRQRWRRAEAAGQGHPLTSAWGSLFWGDGFIYNPGVGMGTPVGTRLRELVAWRGICVLNGWVYVRAVCCARLCAPGEACQRLSQ